LVEIFFEKQETDKSTFAHCYNRIDIDYQKKNDYKCDLYWLNTALIIRKQILNKNLSRIATYLNNFDGAYQAMRKYSKEFPCHCQALRYLADFFTS
jgi:hypothetical protein